MRPQEERDLFVVMRAGGKSYSAITKELHISKATCTKWDKELQEQIAERKAEQLEALYDSYYMTKEARIKRLGETLKKVDAALDKVSFEDMPPDKLLDYKLKYIQALKEEYIYLGRRAEVADEITPTAIMDMLKDLLERLRLGEMDEGRAAKESLIISNLLKAYEQGELKEKMDALEAIVGGRAV